MVAPEVFLIKEDDREMFFAHRPLAGVVFMLIGIGIVYFFSFTPLVKEQMARWVVSAGGALFALIHFPAPWLAGSMIAAILAVLFRLKLEMPYRFRNAASSAAPKTRHGAGNSARWTWIPAPSGWNIPRPRI